ncbi:MAG: hypothetical protein AAFR26_13105 [Cyanobacteria bacterium J06626_4]
MLLGQYSVTTRSPDRQKRDRILGFTRGDRTTIPDQRHCPYRPIASA